MSVSAYLRVGARRPDRRGDAAVDALTATLPFPPEVVRERGFVYGSGRVADRKAVTYGSGPVAYDRIDEAIAELVARLEPHTAALRATSDRLRVQLTIAPDGVGPFALRLPAETFAWLARVNAAVWVDAYIHAPDGTELGPSCSYCGFERPPAGDPRLIDVLAAPGPLDGLADARLVVHGLDAVPLYLVFTAWRFLAVELDDMDIVVLSGRPRPTRPARGGAVMAGRLLRRLRAPRARPVLHALTHASAIELDVRHWAIRPQVDAYLRRRDVRRLARLNAAFRYRLIPDPKPAIGDDARCWHCPYVQPGFKLPGEEMTYPNG
jgi:hypothetical protein